MAGRKDKNTVDYFPHYCKSGKTLFILENKFGNDGYAVWFKTLELLGSNDNHYINCNDISNWEFIQAQMRVSENKLNDILNCLANLDAIHKELWENKIIWSSNFIKNIDDAYLRRKTECMNFYDLCIHLSIKCKHKYSSTGVIDSINTQSIVKDIKVKDIKVDESKNIVFDFKNELLKKCENESLVNDWLLVRKNKKASNTETALKSFLKQVEISGLSVEKVIEKCVYKSWVGFEANWIKDEVKENESQFFTYYNHLLGKQVKQPIPEGMVLKNGYKYDWDYSLQKVFQTPKS